MPLLVDLFRTRLLPAFVAALGASFIAAGLLSYASGPGDEIFSRPTLRPEPSLVAAGSIPPLPTAEPSAEPDPSATPGDSPAASSSPAASPSPESSPSASVPGSPPASPPQSAKPTPAVSGSLPAAPSATPQPTRKPTVTPTPAAGSGGRRVATRVVIPALGIDLPVIRPPGGASTYPVCNVAMYIQSLSQPGEKGATYLYAHARTGMFLPILTASRVNNGRAMIGMLVQVYTSDNRLFLYEIYQVRRHQLTLNEAIAAKSETLWLQTSEGPRGTPGKTQVIARPISSGPADPDEANPVANPVVCG